MISLPSCGTLQGVGERSCRESEGRLLKSVIGESVLRMKSRLRLLMVSLRVILISSWTIWPFLFSTMGLLITSSSSSRSGSNCLLILKQAKTNIMSYFISKILHLSLIYSNIM